MEARVESMTGSDGRAEADRPRGADRDGSENPGDDAAGLLMLGLLCERGRWGGKDYLSGPS